MKRYVIFAYNDYEGCGMIGDVFGVTDDLHGYDPHKDKRPGLNYDNFEALDVVDGDLYEYCMDEDGAEYDWWLKGNLSEYFDFEEAQEAEPVETPKPEPKEKTDGGFLIPPDFYLDLLESFSVRSKILPGTESGNAGTGEYKPPQITVPYIAGMESTTGDAR